jgi:hypothetical protein
MLDPKRISGGGREVAAARRPAQNAKRTLDGVEGVPSHTIPSVRRKAITGFTAAGRDEEGNDRSSSERQQGEERQTSQQADGQGEEQSGRMEEGGGARRGGGWGGGDAEEEAVQLPVGDEEHLALYCLVQTCGSAMEIANESCLNPAPSIHTDTDCTSTCKLVPYEVAQQQMVEPLTTRQPTSQPGCVFMTLFCPHDSSTNNCLHQQSQLLVPHPSNAGALTRTTTSVMVDQRARRNTPHATAALWSVA